jgi:uncharacterized protein (TIGR01777 family)
MTALITGGTGLLGRELLAHLPEAVVLSRDPARTSRQLGGARAIRWDLATEPAPLEDVPGLDAVFHLAGEPVAEGRWTDDKKARIRDSRVQGTRNLVAGLRSLQRKPEVLVCASAVGYYGDRGDEELDESSHAGRGFLSDVCAEWEREALAAEALGMRVVCVRLGIVLTPGGGALARMLTPFKMGAGGRLGTGKQWMPWIHVDDAVGLLLHASRVPSIRGAMNAVSPQPVTNAVFTESLGRAVHRPTVIPMPETALRLVFGEMSAIMLASQKVLPRVAQRTGYEFRYPTLDAALTAVLGAPQPTAA